MSTDARIWVALAIAAAVVTGQWGVPAGLVAFAALAITKWAVSSWLWPFKEHWICAGTGKKYSPSGTAHKPCRGCKGTGKTLRWGRLLYNAMHRNRVDAR